MRRSLRLTCLGLGLLSAACQAPVTTVPQPSPSASASKAPVAASATPLATPTPTAAPTGTPAPAVQQVSVSGTIFDENGAALDGAAVEVTSQDTPAINQTVKAIGGAYILPGVPVGATLRLRAYKDGYDSRFRTVRATLNPPDSDTDSNHADFGGSADGQFFALSQYPDITSVSPVTRSTGVPAGPLDLTFTFSHPMNLDARNAFSSLLQIQFPLAASGAPGGATEAILGVGTSYDDKNSVLTWDPTGTIATFHFVGPLVSRPAGYAAPISIRLLPSAAIANYPKSVNGLPLGRGYAPVTYDGSGSVINNQIAPFLRPALDPAPSPSPRPLGIDLWGAVHMTTSTFTLAQDTTVPRVTGVVAQAGAGSNTDRFVVTFDHAMRGFPEAALDHAALQPSNYRYFLGKNTTQNDRQNFAAGNPASSGSVTSLSPIYSSIADNVVILQMPAGTLSGYTDFKFYVDPAVEDAAGIAIKTSSPDPSTHLSDNAIQGTIQ